MVQDTELTAALLRQHMEDNAMDKDKIRKGVRLILEGVGEDISSEGASLHHRCSRRPALRTLMRFC